MKNSRIAQLLAGKGENYILPFMWQHGEDEQTLREYVQVIRQSGCRAVCLEARPHPDFAGTAGGTTWISSWKKRRNWI